MNFRLLALAALFSATAHAADFPERPVQIIAPYAAGGGLDTITRTLAARLSLCCLPSSLPFPTPLPSTHKHPKPSSISLFMKSPRCYDSM